MWSEYLRYVEEMVAVASTEIESADASALGIAEHTKAESNVERSNDVEEDVTMRGCNTLIFTPPLLWYRL